MICDNLTTYVRATAIFIISLMIQLSVFNTGIMKFYQQLLQKTTFHAKYILQVNYNFEITVFLGVDSVLES